MADLSVLLVGFEGALAQAIADRFRFSGPTLRNIALVPGRHLFVQDLPTSQVIAQNFAGFDVTVEPAIVLYTAGGTPPSSGGRHEFRDSLRRLCAPVPQLQSELHRLPFVRVTSVTLSVPA